MEALNKSNALQMIYPDFHANLNKRNKKTFDFSQEDGKSINLVAKKATSYC